MDIDPKKEVQHFSCGNQTYVLVREEVYERLLRRLDSLHAALQLQRNRAEISTDLLETLVRERLTPRQVQDVLREPALGKRIALLRGFRGYGQVDFADRVGVNQSTISKLESGETARPSFELIHAVMKALELPDVVSYTLLRKESVAAGRSNEVARV